MEKTSLSKQNESLTSKKHVVLAVITGVGAGIANGIFGGGGGMIVVPMLTMLLKYPAKNAHATAILIILPLSIVSGLFYLALGVQVLTLVPVMTGVIIGGVIGSVLLSKLSSKWITLIFSFVMAIAGLKMLIF